MFTTEAGKASTSTFNPTPSAVDGDTVARACSMCSVLVHNCSSPNVSKRKIDLPSGASALEADWLIDNSATVATQETPTSTGFRVMPPPGSPRAALLTL